MAKSETSGNRTWGFVLAFLGTLTFLYVAFYLVGGASVWTSGASLADVVWAAFLGLAAVGSVSLFLASFGLLKGQKMATEMVWKISFPVGIVLVALTAGNGAWAWYALLGFVLTTLGVIVATM